MIKYYGIYGSKTSKNLIILTSIFSYFIFFKCRTAQPFFYIFDSNTRGPSVQEKNIFGEKKIPNWGYNLNFLPLTPCTPTHNQCTFINLLDLLLKSIFRHYHIKNLGFNASKARYTSWDHSGVTYPRSKCTPWSLILLIFSHFITKYCVFSHNCSRK